MIPTPVPFEQRLRDFLLGPIILCEVCHNSVDPRDLRTVAIPTDDPDNHRTGHPVCVRAWYNDQQPRRRRRK